MSTNNIGFYEDLTKIIFELSSNIIKYAPYFFCWSHIATLIQTSLLRQNQKQGALIVQLGERQTRSQGCGSDPHPGRGVVPLSKTLHPHC